MIHKRVRVLLSFLLALSACGQPAESARAADALANVREQVIAYAPYKQWNLTTGQANREIGRTPGAACEVIKFLVVDGQASGGERSHQAAVRLADWVIDLQQAGSELSVAGGVPSTPDLAPPGNAYYYTIDAALCGAAMLDLAEMTGEARYERSAVSFGRFILDMARGPQARASRLAGAPCEYVVQTARQDAAWNCQRFVKNMIALPLLLRLERRHPAQGFGTAGMRLRAALLPGLEGLWEYGVESGHSLSWKRVDGPHQEKDYFVYGDTLAYALAGLHGYEGASPLVRRLYARFSGMRGRHPSVTNYDGRIALAGYVIAGKEEPDPLSAYYDTVTLGILQPLRREVSPIDAAAALEVLTRKVAAAPKIGWRMDMAYQTEQRGMADASMLAWIGLALTAAGHPALARAD